MADELNLEAERAKFEAAWRKRYSMPASVQFSAFSGGRYLATAIGDAFEGWQMARRAAPIAAPAEQRDAWISTVDRLPEDGEEVVVLIEHDMMMSENHFCGSKLGYEWVGDDGKRISSRDQEINRVIGWKPRTTSTQPDTET